MTNVIMFCFAGRRANMELQLPFIRRILDDNPNVEYHCWDLSRTKEDSEYLHTISHERLEIIDDFACEEPWKRFDDVYRHYAKEIYRDCLFVKLDDDIVFIEIDKFKSFIASVDKNRGAIISANVINNGACSKLDYKLSQLPNELGILRTLEIHEYAEYAMQCHEHFFNNWPYMIIKVPSLSLVKDWLSINLIGYDWNMGKRIASELGRPSPRRICGRFFKRYHVIGDEGRVNMLPRAVMDGFVASHLTFGPQETQMTDEDLSVLRKRYAEIGRKYLERPYQ